MTPSVANLNPATSLLPTILSMPTSRRTMTGPHMVMAVGTITISRTASQTGEAAIQYIRSMGTILLGGSVGIGRKQAISGTLAHSTDRRDADAEHRGRSMPVHARPLTMSLRTGSSVEWHQAKGADQSQGAVSAPALGRSGEAAGGARAIPSRCRFSTVSS